MIIGKKGSLALSMNAIVVLIMAIAMLGVGLGVIQMVRQKAEVSLEQLASEEPEAPTASPSDPLTISRGTIPVKAGGEFIVKVSYYNSDGDKCKVSSKCEPTIDCGDLILNNPETNAKTIAAFESASFIYKAEVPSNAPTGFKVCTLKITNGGTEEKDLVIKVI